jgi:polysaccharide deacetylase family protein (PEP-CTERM system associated)
MNTNNAILITIDVEDWFQVENFKRWISFSSWPSYKLRVENNIHQILDLLDSTKTCKRYTPNDSRDVPKATFFILGWIAKRIPHLVREIHHRGHEVASHGFNHNLYTDLPLQELKTDLTDSRKYLEDIIGSRIYGHRAPSFSINEKILKVIAECGYSYDSSYNSFAMHDRYGHIDVSQNDRKGIAIKLGKNFHELPISNIKIGRTIFPMGGGAYFRLIPLFLFKMGVKLILAREHAYIFYLHPWEIDPNQPRVNSAFLSYKFRHYTNLRKNREKLATFFESFNESRFITCRQYLEQELSDEYQG